MTRRSEILLLTGAAAVIGFMLLALIPNPFVPDVCTSAGYGYPLPVYISWCECFVENPRPPVNVAYLSIDFVTWGVLWLSTSAVLLRISGRSSVQVI